MNFLTGNFCPFSCLVVDEASVWQTLIYGECSSNSEVILHHHDELLVVDLSIVVFVHPVQQLSHLLLAQREVLARKALSELIFADSSVVVFVEVRESRTQVVFF